MGAMLRKLILITSSVLILSGCYNEEEAKETVKAELSEFFNLLLLEEIDPLMEKFVQGTDLYYEFFPETISLFEDYNYDYKINEISFVSSSDEKQVVNVLVGVSGTDNEKKKIQYDSLYTFTFVPTSKSEYKIEFLDVKYNL